MKTHAVELKFDEIIAVISCENINIARGIETEFRRYATEIGMSRTYKNQKEIIETDDIYTQVNWLADHVKSVEDIDNINTSTQKNLQITAEILDWELSGGTYKKKFRKPKEWPKKYSDRADPSDCWDPNIVNDENPILLPTEGIPCFEDLAHHTCVANFKLPY
jgi:hypothetical protein